MIKDHFRPVKVVEIALYFMCLILMQKVRKDHQATIDESSERISQDNATEVLAKRI